MSLENKGLIRFSIRRPFIAVAALLLVLLLSACGELTPSGQTDQLLINEIYTGTAPGGVQWIEVLNNSNNDLKLDGYKLATPQGTIDLGALSANSPFQGTLGKGKLLVVANYPQTINDGVYKMLQDAATTDAARAAIKRPALPLEERTVLGKLDPQKGLVALRGPDNTLLDQAGWGNSDLAARTSLGITTDLNLNLPAPNNETKSLGRTPHFGQREDPGPINPGVFTLHNTVTPGLNDTPRTAVSKNYIFTTFTDVISTIAGALLWLVFFIIALVAKRFETLSEQKTYWQYLMVAPAGILIYLVLQVQDFIRQGRLTDFWSWPAFLALFFSGVACVYVINIFRLIAKNILEAE